MLAIGVSPRRMVEAAEHAEPEHEDADPYHSPAAGFAWLLRRFDQRMADVAAFLLISLSWCYSCHRRAHHQASGQWPLPGDLKNAGEEFECAQQIDLLDEVASWVRNLVHDTQFWLPTSKQRTYPDFVAKLKDGRLFVVEYKGGDRITADQEEEKRLLGELWARRSKGRGVYLMASKANGDLRGQLRAAITAR